MPELVAKADPISRLSVVDTEFPTEVKFDFLPEEAAPRALRHFYLYRKVVINSAASVLCLTRVALNFLAKLNKLSLKQNGLLRLGQGDHIAWPECERVAWGCT